MWSRSWLVLGFFKKCFDLMNRCWLQNQDSIINLAKPSLKCDVINDLFDQTYNPSHSILYPDVLKTKNNNC